MLQQNFGFIYLKCLEAAKEFIFIMKVKNVKKYWTFYVLYNYDAYFTNIFINFRNI